MDPAIVDIVAPMIFLVVLTLTVGGVILLKPLSRRLADLLEVMASERKDPALAQGLSHLQQQLDTVTSRLTLLEERQDFQERLLENPERLSRRPDSGAGQSSQG